MIIAGNINTIEAQLHQIIDLLKQNPLFSGSVSINMSLSIQNKSILLVDKNTLREADVIALNPQTASDRLFLIEEDIYNLFKPVTKSPDTVSDKHVPIISDETWEPYEEAFSEVKSPVTGLILDEAYSTCVIAQTSRKKAKTTHKMNKQNNTFAETELTEEEAPVFATLNEYYRIEDHIEESVRLQKPCAFGIKYLDDNYFVLYYRRSVYEKGTDTTFRHFLCRQPGTLVAYRYFKDLSSLRYIFDKQGHKLHHNGQNNLSREQADEIVKYFTKCW